MNLACRFLPTKAINSGVVAAKRSFNFSPKFSRQSCIQEIRMEKGQNNCLNGGGSESRGALIVLEGLDRSGKSLQSTRLLSFLEEPGHPTELWRFPDRTTSIGQMISSYLSNESQLDDYTTHLLFSANRWEKRSLMEKKLKSGTTLIVDRYSYSGIAFSSAKGLDFEWCKAPEIGLPAPDLVFYLDIPPEKAAERGGYGGERYEKLEFQRKVGKSYKALLDASWTIVDALLPMEDIAKQMQEIAVGCLGMSERQASFTSVVMLILSSNIEDLAPPAHCFPREPDLWLFISHCKRK